MKLDLEVNIYVCGVMLWFKVDKLIFVFVGFGWFLVWKIVEVVLLWCRVVFLVVFFILVFFVGVFVFDVDGLLWRFWLYILLWFLEVVGNVFIYWFFCWSFIVILSLFLNCWYFVSGRGDFFFCNLKCFLCVR